MTTDAEPAALCSERLILEPLCAGHAVEMAPLLADPRLCAFTGGEPPTLHELRARYERQAAGRSPDGVERWFNWIVRRRDDGAAVGYVQATVSEDQGPITAVLAWVVGVAFHGQGYAREAAATAITWLHDSGVERFVAYIHPGHRASMGVARAIEMAPTIVLVDGEVVWERRAGET